MCLEAFKYSTLDGGMRLLIVSRLPRKYCIVGPPGSSLSPLLASGLQDSGISSFELSPFSRNEAREWAKSRAGWSHNDEFVDWSHEYTLGHPRLFTRLIVDTARLLQNSSRGMEIIESGILPTERVRRLHAPDSALSGTVAELVESIHETARYFGHFLPANYQNAVSGVGALPLYEGLPPDVVRLASGLFVQQNGNINSIPLVERALGLGSGGSQ